MTTEAQPVENPDTEPATPSGEFNTEDYARLAVDLASDRLGSDIALLDLRGVSDFADYFVIVSGETARHLDAIAGDLVRGLRGRGLRVHHREGAGQGGWILIDYGAIVVHIFDRESRERYALERLWSRAREIVRVQ